jgi:hypothetical protein
VTLENDRNNLPVPLAVSCKSFRSAHGLLATPLKPSCMPSPATSRRNLEKAKKCWRAPLPWRDVRETRLIKALAWRWYRFKEPNCAGREIARLLGVSHTYIQKLAREFESDARNIVRQERAYGPATFAQLHRAHEESTRLRERGWLRSSNRWVGLHVAASLPAAPQFQMRQQLAVDPEVELRRSALIAGEEQKVRPIPFFRRWRPGRGWV